ncbi:ribosome biogenesis GTP-binding protein YihA/YsxC [Ructibacterium gallinarum]|uniref:Probable GTP-binding protein EngB n=1 Tax=Ructibacterium gallinarum TaxID=2779355 RepID=A0A9D5LWC0_9FIRM|nr:ribosome biogenesis GTP-binding protein YihA/YsxC [Ructibacterium gallinarum]MBE5038866.1 YihA family ribosome biogenesis GTP-binding protein [Ructibacterium gallinarum]
MEYIDAKLLITAVKPSQYPDTLVPEIAFVGRSNVGKSSLINCLTNRNKLARTSSTPGKTATINFYDIAGRFRLVDLPGYGYAKVSKTEQERWAKMIETYLTDRYNLVQVIQLVDARHKPTQDDITMLNWIRRFGYTPVVVATKLDKLKKSQIESNLTLIYHTLALDDSCFLLPFSAEKKTGREDLAEFIDTLCSRFHPEQQNILKNTAKE